MQSIKRTQHYFGSRKTQNLTTTGQSCYTVNGDFEKSVNAILVTSILEMSEKGEGYTFRIDISVSLCVRRCLLYTSRCV